MLRNSVVPTFSSECGGRASPHTLDPTGGCEDDPRVSKSTSPAGFRLTKSLTPRMSRPPASSGYARGPSLRGPHGRSAPGRARFRRAGCGAPAPRSLRPARPATAMASYRSCPHPTEPHLPWRVASGFYRVGGTPNLRAWRCPPRSPGRTAARTPRRVTDPLAPVLPAAGVPPAGAPPARSPRPSPQRRPRVTVPPARVPPRPCRPHGPALATRLPAPHRPLEGRAFRTPPRLAWPPEHKRGHA